MIAEPTDTRGLNYGSSLYLHAHGSLRQEYFGGIAFNAQGTMLRLKHAEARLFQYLLERPHRVPEVLEFIAASKSEGLQKLLLSGMVVPSDKKTSDSNTARAVFPFTGSQGYLQSPVSVHLYPTYACNQNCIFCYSPSCALPKGRLPNKLTSRILKFLDQLEENGVVVLNLLGGEPLLYLDTVMDIFGKASSFLYCAMASNGSACGGFTPEQSRCLAAIPNIDMRISLHAPSREIHDRLVRCPGAFETAVRSIRTLAGNGVKCSVSCLPTKANAKTIPTLIENARSWGASGFFLLPVHPTARFDPSHPIWLDSETHGQLIDQMKSLQAQYASCGFEVRYRDWYDYMSVRSSGLTDTETFAVCVAGREILEIDPKGDAYPCNMTLGMPEFRIGNAYDMPLNDLWKSSKFAPFRSRTPAQIVNQRCQACGFLPRCLGGCPMSAYVLGGGLNAGDPRCPRLSTTAGQDVKKD